MAYQNYLRNLDFGGVSDSIQTLKSQEYGRLTNSLDAKSLDLQGQINNLGEDESIKDKLESTVTTIGDATGISLESGGLGKTAKSLVKGLKDKFGSVKDTATKLKGQAEDAVGKLKGQAEDTVGKLKGQAEDTVGKLKGQAEDAVGKLKPQAEGEAEEPSEFMNALKNDDFSAMRRMLGDEGSAEPVNEAGAFKGTVPDDTYGNQRGELTDSARELSEPAEAPSEVADAPEAGLDSASYPDFSQWFNDNGKRLGDQIDRDLDPAGDASGPVERLGENDSFADFLNDNAMEPRFETRYNMTDMTNSAPARPNTPVERTDAAEPEADAEPQFGDKPMTGRAVGDRYGGQQEPSNAPDGVEYEEQTLPDEMIHGGGDTEMTTFSSNVGRSSYANSFNETGGISTEAEIAQPSPSEGASVADGASKGGTVASDGADVAADTAGAAEEGTTAAGEAAGEGAAEAGEIAGEVAGDVAVEAGTEVAGAALDSTGILAPLGLLLQVGGAIFGAVETAKSAMDEKSMTSSEDAQNALAQQKNAIQKNIASQQFVGANVTPGLSTTTANAVTSGAF